MIKIEINKLNKICRITSLPKQKSILILTRILAVIKFRVNNFFDIINHFSDIYSAFDLQFTVLKKLEIRWKSMSRGCTNWLRWHARLYYSVEVKHHRRRNFRNLRVGQTVEKQNRVDPIDLRTIARLGTVLRRAARAATSSCSRISVGGNYSTPLRLIALID